MTAISSAASHKWIFTSRFRRHTFGWRSQPAIKRIREAVSEIKKVSRKEPFLGGEGAVLFLEMVSAAIEQVDGSSGSIGVAVDNAIYELVQIIANAPADDKRREKWLERLWQAVENDRMPYIEALTDYWGELCVTPERASCWADEFIDMVRMAWSADAKSRYYFKGTSACLSALLKAGRYAEILDLLNQAPYRSWSYRQWGVKALMGLGKMDEALQYAEDSRGLNDNPISIAQVCEEILLASGRFEEAYNRYAFVANRKTTYLATFRAIAKKYPSKQPAAILNDLIAGNPGEEGKWFAAAMSIGQYAKAVELAFCSPCDPKTLTRAARDVAGNNPQMAVEFGIAALMWLTRDYGYDITSLDVWAAFNHTMGAATLAGSESETFRRIQSMVEDDRSVGSFVRQTLGKKLGYDE